MNYPKIPLSDTQIINDAIETLTGNKARWVLWRLEEDKKVPYTKGNKYASVTNPDDWLTYNEVQTGLASDGEYSGAGLVLDGTILGIDLDKCLNSSGELTDPILEAFVAEARTYTEISPSGTGLHILFKLSTPINLVRNRRSGIEIYTKDRYLTFTGNLFEQHAIRTISSTEAEQLLSIVGYPWLPAISPTPTTPITHSNQQPLPVDQLKQKMFASKQGEEIKALFNGDTSKYANDDSRADAALCKYLAYWTNNDRETIKSLWLSSDLGQRDKAHREDYIERTLDFTLSDSNGGSTQELSASSGTSDNGSQEITNANKVPKNPLAEIEMDLEDLLKLDIKIEWDVEQLIPKGSLNMIASLPHQGKTFMALHIAICLANGLPVFGKFKVTETKNVLIVNEEDVIPDIKNRLECMVPTERTQKQIKLYCNGGQKISPEWVDNLLERAQANDAGLIILDSLAALSLANENDAREMQLVMDQLRRLVVAGITVIFIHHNRKGQNGESGTNTGIEMARGSTVITAVPQSYLSIQALANEQFKISQLKLKANVAKMKPFLVQMHTNVTPQATFRYEFEYLGEYDSDRSAVDDTQEKIIRYCRSQGVLPFTRKSLVQAGLATSAEDQTLRKSLLWMESNGYLTSEKYGTLPNDKQRLISSQASRHNTLVYTPTLKLQQSDAEKMSGHMEETATDNEEEQDSIPF